MKKDEMIKKLHKTKKTPAPFPFRNVIHLRYYSLKKVSSIYRDYHHLLVPKLEVNSNLITKFLVCDEVLSQRSLLISIILLLCSDTPGTLKIV